jgi:DHA2 family multidrug resistance protein
MADRVGNVPYRGLITAAAMLSVLMQALDSTIANVALPYMQGSLSASWDEITWVLTSYVIAAAIMTAPVGWLAVRFGRKRLFIVCLLGFTVTSMLCGAAQTLGQIVVFRLLQGMCGAALVPLSQATMLDIYPFEKRAQAMAIFGMGVMMGPILGPTLGGYLTDWYNWRWVFYVNLPFGILAIAGLALFMPKTLPKPELRFDWTGFGVLAMGIGCMQLMLDRGQDQDWFSAREIIVEAVLAALGFYLFVVHMLTAEKPFLAPAVFRDRNFVCCAVLMFSVQILLMSSSALLAPYLQTLGGYPVSTAGLAMAPRGVGTACGMFLASRMAQGFDQRKIIAVGLLGLGWTLHLMSGWTPDVAHRTLLVTLLVQGFAMGLVFNPMTVVAFTTLSPALRGDATSMQALARNIGAAIGISVTTFMLARSTQALHQDIAAYVNPFNRALQVGGTIGAYWPLTLNPTALVTVQQSETMLDQIVNRQASILAYANDYWLMAFVVLPPLLLLLLMRRPDGRTVSAGSASVPPQANVAEAD